MQSFQATVNAMLSPNADKQAELERDVYELRTKLKAKFVENREQLIEELLEHLANLTLIYSKMLRFDETLNSMREIVELGKKLGELGQEAAFVEHAMKIGHALYSVIYLSKSESMPYNRLDEMFDLYVQWVSMTPENEFPDLKDDWAHDINAYAEYLMEIKQYNRALKLAKQTQETLESLLNPRSTQFSEWSHLLASYRLLAEIQQNAGDNDSSLKYYLRYDELGDKAHDILMRNKPAAPMPINRSKGQRVYLSNSSEQMRELMSAIGFNEERYFMMLAIGDMYANIPDQVNALKFYDKAARIARIAYEDEELRHDSQVSELLGAKTNVMLKKARLYEKNNDIENITKQVQYAEKELATVLKEHENDEDFEKKVFQKLKNELDDLQEKHNIKSIINTTLAGIFSKRNKPKDGKSGEIDDDDDLSWEKLRDDLNNKHSEACFFLAHGQSMVMDKRYKPAILELLKARNIFDSFFIQEEFVVSRSNLLVACVMLAKSYLKLGDATTAEKWCKRALVHLEYLIKKKAELESLTKKDAREEFETKLLKPVNKFAISTITFEQMADIYCTSGRFEEAIKMITKVYDLRKTWSQEKWNEMRLSKKIKDRDEFSETLSDEINVIRGLEECCCAIGRFDEAINWGNIEAEKFNALCNFSSEIIPIANIFRSKADFSVAALLLCAGKVEQADAIIEKIAQRLVNNGIDGSIELAKERVDSFVALRRSMLMSSKEFPDERAKLIQARKIILKQPENAAILFNEVLEKFETIRKNVENEHRIIRKQWDMLIKYVNIALDYCKGDQKEWHNLTIIRVNSDNKLKYMRTEENEIDLELLLSRGYDSDFDFGEITHPDPEGIDEEIEKHNYDFDEAIENPVAPEYDIFAEGATKEQRERIEKLRDAMIWSSKQQKFDQIRKNAGNKVGRNDPCPCGSGKKYKKCCMLKEQD
jgi:hypothetical protein